MAALNNVVLLCILAKFVLCEEDANTPQALPQTGLGNIYNNLYGAQFEGGANLANTYGLNFNSAGLRPNMNGINLNNGALNLNQANFNQAGFNLNQGGYLLNQQPQYTGINTGFLNFNQQPQLSGLNLNNGGYSTLNLQSPINGASYGGAYGNAYSGLTGTDLSSFLGTAIKNYNQQAGTGLDSSLASQMNVLGTPAIDNSVQNSKIQKYNMGTVTPGSDLLHPQSLVPRDVSQGNHFYNPQSISLQGHQPQLSQQQRATSYSDVKKSQPAPVVEPQINNIQQAQSSQNAQFGSQSGFQPIHIGGINSASSLDGNTDFKSLFNQYGSNQYGYGIGGLLDNKFKSGSINFNDDGSNKYQLFTPAADTTHIGITENEKFKSEQNLVTSHKSTGLSGFKDTVTDPTSMKANTYSFNNLNTDSHRSYGQGSVENAYKFNQNGPHQFKIENFGANGFGGNNNMFYGGGHNFKPNNLEMDAFESLQQAFKTAEPKLTSFKSNPSGLQGHKTNDYTSDLPKRTVYKYNDIKPHISKDIHSFESSEFKPYDSNNRYTSNNVRQPKQNNDYELFEYGKPQFSSHKFGNDQHKGFEGNNQNSYRSYPNKKHNIYSDFGRYGQNAYKGNKNNNQNTYERPEGNNNVENSLNTGKKGSGMVVHISVKNGEHGYTQSLRYP